MKDENRLSIKVGGASGQGINSVGEIFGKSIKNIGYYVFGYREYPSLIRGGYASYQIDFSDENINSSSMFCDVFICQSELAFDKYYTDVREEGVVIHSINNLSLDADQQSFITKNKVKIIYLDGEKVAIDLGGTKIMANVVLVGLVWKILGFELSDLEEEIKDRFKDKPDLLPKDLECLKAGYKSDLVKDITLSVGFSPNKEVTKSMIISGNFATALGAISAGVRAYYAYPMTPASSILTYIADTQGDTGILVKQAEDEISAAQMTLGSMFMGTRALVATSGGGFDLMTETLSLTGMTETPFVCVIVQRPGPATGVPTWTASADLNIALYAAHGEFPRIVVSASDGKSANTVIQNAFNLAEKYQVPVLVLSDKQIAESLFNIDKFDKPIQIERNIVKDVEKMKSEDRFASSNTGVSKRWLPGQCDAVYTANSDEHLSDGSLTEESIPVKEMIEKRMRKVETITKELPEPVLLGNEDPDIVFVGWGSAKSSVLDVIDVLEENNYGKKVGYLHYEYLFPLKTSELMNLVGKGKRMILIENNYSGQLGDLVKKTCGYEFVEKLLKYDGRPFFIEDILDYLEKNDG
jgi:2-oxoglutarate ferredoxin oxidoreductase subunit alpha